MEIDDIKAIGFNELANDICGKIQDGYTLNIHLENGSGWVTVSTAAIMDVLPDDLFDDETMSQKVIVATSYVNESGVRKMSMSTHIILLRDSNDETYQKYRKVLNACKEADIDVPPEVNEYFGGDGMDANPEDVLEIDYDAPEWESEYANGYEIALKDLPSGVDRIRFYNAY